VSGWEAAVLALDLIHIFKEDAATKRVKFVKVGFTTNTSYFPIFVGKKYCWKKALIPGWTSRYIQLPT
jgi:hypothetical protein